MAANLEYDKPVQTRADLHDYAVWLNEVWLPAVTHGLPGHKPKPERPSLTLIKGGRDAC